MLSLKAIPVIYDTEKGCSVLDLTGEGEEWLVRGDSPIAVFIDGYLRNRFYTLKRGKSEPTVLVESEK